VTARHAVLADEQWLAGKHTDTPVKLGRQKLLRQYEVGLLEQLVGDARSSSGVFTLCTPARERAVRI
jgi:hypothetical protein